DYDIVAHENDYLINNAMDINDFFMDKLDIKVTYQNHNFITNEMDINVAYRINDFLNKKMDINMAYRIKINDFIGDKVYNGMTNTIDVFILDQRLTEWMEREMLPLLQQEYQPLFRMDGIDGSMKVYVATHY
ncbi:GIP, partial [Symbiodinium microadriaticum]